MAAEPRPPLPAEDLEDLQARLGASWDRLRGGRLLLTGCTGFFGAWLVEGLLAAVERRGLDLEAVLLTRDPEGFQRGAPHLAGHPALRLHAGDIRDFQPPAGAFTHLIHGAVSPSATLNAERPGEMLETLVEGTRRALDVALGAGVGDALFVSSGAVYGPQPPGLAALPEDHPGAPDPADPLAAYGLGKRLAEHLCHRAARESGLRIRVARCFAFLGPAQGLGGHQAASAFLGQALGDGVIRVQGDGTPVRAWLYAKDLALWLWTMLLEGRPGGVWNVGSDEARSVSDLAGVVASACGGRVEVAARPVEGAPVHRYVPDVSRAARDLGLAPTVGLEEAVRRTLRWCREGDRPDPRP